MQNTHEIPLAERMRPQTLGDVAGQKHLTGPDGILHQMLLQRRAASIIFQGPPGVGKTTLARLMAQGLGLPFYQLSAISSGVKEVRGIIDKSAAAGTALLFIDEIHRFNKSQQDALLGAVEAGVIILIGATTENPSFEVNAALLSRCQVYRLEALTQQELLALAQKAIATDPRLSSRPVTLVQTEALLQMADGDARRMYNLLDLMDRTAPPGPILVNNKMVTQTARQKVAYYDKKGEMHYDVISAFIKSVRGSDPNAAVYYLSRMLQAGEDIKFIARRIIILASEDIGNANPNALLLASQTFTAVMQVGMPEAEIILAQTVTYLACSPKSNAAYKAIKQANKLVKDTGDLPVPMHLRNAPTKLMKNQGYAQGYKYAHDYPGNFTEQEFLPDNIKGTCLYQPSNNKREDELRNQLRKLWNEKYGY